MANGDIPPAVSVSISSAHSGGQGITIPCQNAEQESLIFKLIADLVNAVKAAYQKD